MRPKLKKGSANMRILIGGISICGAIGIIFYLSTVAMNGWLKAVLVALTLLFLIFTLAYTFKEAASGKDTGK